MRLRSRGSSTPSGPTLHQFPGPFEVGRGIDLDAEPSRVDQADRDAHAGFERAQLLEPLALFEDAARQADIAVERGAAIGVKPDMLVMRPLAPRHDRLRKIERARRRSRRAACSAAGSRRGGRGSGRSDVAAGRRARGRGKRFRITGATRCPVRMLAGSVIIQLSRWRESGFLPPAARPASAAPPRWRKAEGTPMPSFEWNKIIASVLTAMIIAMVAGILASEIVRPKHLEKEVYLPPGAEAGATAPAAGAAEAAAAPEPIEQALAKADPAHGQQVAKVCLQCHT